MAKLKKITPLERQIDILSQHIKRCELDLQELCDLRPPERKRGKSPKYWTVKSGGKEFKLLVG